MIGIGDGKTDLFKDPRFLALGIKNVRYDMAWDAMADPKQRLAATRWLNGAKSDGLSVLLTIDHSRRVIYKRVPGKKKLQPFGQSRVMPSTAAYLKAFRDIRARFPWVTQFATWDETNCYCEVTYNKETQVASYYRALRSACPKCTILAAEFLDIPKHLGIPMTTWASAFIKAAGGQPQYWGLNDYEEANHLVSTSVRQLLATVQGKVWLAETGGIVNRSGIVNPGFPQNAAHAGIADDYLLNTIGTLSPRIQRIYLYEWDAKTPRDGWDSALISYTGAPRQGYMALAKTLNAWGIRPICAISRVPPSCDGTPRASSTSSTTS